MTTFRVSVCRKKHRSEIIWLDYKGEKYPKCLECLKVCVNGHNPLEQGYHVRVTNGAVVTNCALCAYSRSLRYQKSPAGRAKRTREQQERRKVARERREVADRLLALKREQEEEELALKDDNRPMAPWNLLRVREEAREAWSRFQESMDFAQAKCKGDTSFTDYADPRDSDEENAGLPSTPTRQQARLMCEGCPFFDNLCKDYAELAREDWGVINGKVWIGGVAQ